MYYTKRIGLSELDILVALEKASPGEIVPSFSTKNGVLLIERYPMTLAEYIENHDISSVEALGDIADKIDHMIKLIHSHGILHGDLHTGNIVINPDTRTVRIIDFGESMMITNITGCHLKRYTEFWASELPSSLNMEQLLDNETKMWKLDYFCPAGGGG